MTSNTNTTTQNSAHQDAVEKIGSLIERKREQQELIQQYRNKTTATFQQWQAQELKDARRKIDEIDAAIKKLEKVR